MTDWVAYKHGQTLARLNKNNMATNFPTSLDDFTNPTPGQTEGTSSKVGEDVGGRTHAEMHSDENDAIEALQTKVGIDASTPVANTVLGGDGAGHSSWRSIKTEDIDDTDKSGSDDTLMTGTAGAEGNLAKFNADGDIVDTGFGTIIPLENGGTGASLVDPNTDAIIMWNDTSGETQFATLGSGLFFDGNELTAAGSSLVDTFTAAYDITAGDMVGNSLFMDETAGPSLRILSGLDGMSTPDTLSSQVARYAPIDTDKFVAVYFTAANTIKAAVATVDRDTMSISFGSSVTISTDADSTDAFDVCKLDTDKFAVSFAQNTDDKKLEIVGCTVSGSTITVGTVTTSYTAATTITEVAMTQIGTDKCAYIIKETSGGNAVAVTWSGTTPTSGSAVDPGGNIVQTFVIEKIGTDKFAVMSRGYAIVATISGTTITFGTEVNSSLTGTLSSLTGIDLVSHDTDKFVMMSSSHAIAATVSGTTITFGAEVTHGAGASGSMYVKSTTEVVFLGTSTILATILGTTITTTTVVGSNISDSNNLTDRNGALNLGTYFIWVKLTSTTELRYFIEGMAIGFVGIAQSTVSRGATLNVLMGGIDSNQTSLIAGATYTLDYGGTLRITNLATIDELNEEILLRAISSTKLIF